MMRQYSTKSPKPILRMIRMVFRWCIMCLWLLAWFQIPRGVEAEGTTSSNNGSGSIAVGQAPQDGSAPEVIIIGMENGDATSPPPGYIVYDIPPFWVSFQTINSLSGDSELDAQILQQEMTRPFKSILGNFVKLSFATELAQLEQEQQQQAEAEAEKPGTQSIPPVLFDFVSLDFQVTLQHLFFQSSGRRQRRRQLRSWQPGQEQQQPQFTNEPGRSLAQGDGDDTTNQDGLWYLEFYADFVGQAYFIAPVAGDVGEHEVPTQDDVAPLFLGWLNHYFQDPTWNAQLVPQFQQQQSTPILQNMQSLTISTNTSAIPQPFRQNSPVAHGLPSHEDQPQRPANGGNHPWNTNNPSAASSQTERSTVGHLVMTILILMACVMLVIVGVLLFRYSLPYMAPYFARSGGGGDHSMDPTHHPRPSCGSHGSVSTCSVTSGAAANHNHTGSSSSMMMMNPLAHVFPIHFFKTKKDDSFHRKAPGDGGDGSHDGSANAGGRNDPLPGRRGEDADEEMLLRQESDRWLKEHRPDLYEVVQKSATAAAKNNNNNNADAQSLSSNSGILNAANNDNTNNSRRSMPMQFLLGGLFKAFSSSRTTPASNNEQQQQQQAPPPPPEHHMYHDENFVISDEDGMELYHDDYYEDDGPFVMVDGSGSPNWWGKVLHRLTKEQQQHQNNTMNSTLACEEDPSSYSFAFQDFPRSDGTPCLIYTESNTATHSHSKTKSSSSASSLSRPFSPTDPLSNDEFKRVLSLNSEDNLPLDGDDTGHDDDDEDDDDDGSRRQDDEFEDEIVFTTPLPKSPEFTEKLERLVSMRLRHYERQNLVQKHKKTKEQQKLQQQQKQVVEQQQKQQKQRLLQEESRQRELKLRRHEMELDMNEIEGSLAPRAIARRDRQTSTSGGSHSATTTTTSASSSHGNVYAMSTTTTTAANGMDHHHPNLNTSFSSNCSSGIPMTPTRMKKNSMTTPTTTSSSSAFYSPPLSGGDSSGPHHRITASDSGFCTSMSSMSDVAGFHPPSIPTTRIPAVGGGIVRAGSGTFTTTTSPVATATADWTAAWANQTRNGIGAIDSILEVSSGRTMLPGGGEEEDMDGGDELMGRGPRNHTTTDRHQTSSHRTTLSSSSCSTMMKRNETPLNDIDPNPNNNNINNNSNATGTKKNVAPSRAILKTRMGRQRSHRRWASHGTDPEATKKVDCCLPPTAETFPSEEQPQLQRNVSTLNDHDDVMTFGIAAYTDFV